MINKLITNKLVSEKDAFFLCDCNEGNIYLSKEAEVIIVVAKDDIHTDKSGSYITYECMVRNYILNSEQEINDFEGMYNQTEDVFSEYMIKFKNTVSCKILSGMYIKAIAVYENGNRYVLALLKTDDDWISTCPSLMSKFTISPFSGLKNKYALYNVQPNLLKSSNVYLILIGNYHLVEREHGENASRVIRSIVDEITRFTEWEQVFHFEKDKIVIIDSKGLNSTELFNNLNSFVYKIVKGIDVFVSMCSISNDSFEYDSISKFFYVVDIFVSNTSLRLQSMYIDIDKDCYNKYKEKDYINNLVINAVRNEQIDVSYQPQICLKTGNVVGFEALLRPNIDGIPITTARFINICNTNGLLSKLDGSVLKKSLKMYNKIKETGFDIENFIVSVNITPGSLPKVSVDSIVQLVENENVPTTSVKLELLEDAIVGDNEIKILKKLSNAGFKIAIDDFSAGHSSLKYLLKIAPDTVKLDKGIIPNIDNDKEKLIYRYITNLCKELGFSTIAEGVETIEELEFMKELGIDMVQGYYFSKALREDEFINYITQSRK